MTGSVTLSIEVELGWGMHDKGTVNHLSKDGKKERKAMASLLKLCEQLQISVSFDVVGHLLLKSCDGSHEGPYPSGWWDADPGTNSATDPLFYAPDLIKSIVNHSVDHEIATHTFSHALARVMSAETLREEISTSVALHQEFGLSRPVSIVMPRHQEPDYEILAEYDIEVIRRPIQSYGATFSNPLGSFYWILTRDHPACEIHSKNGIIETTATPHPSLTTVSLPTGQSMPHPVFRAIPRRLRSENHRRYLNNAIERAADGEHIHLWTHLYDFSNESQWAPLAAGLRKLASHRDKGQLEIKRMRDFSEHRPQ